jgi:hypothetical protein
MNAKTCLTSFLVVISHLLCFPCVEIGYSSELSNCQMKTFPPNALFALVYLTFHHPPYDYSNQHASTGARTGNQSIDYVAPWPQKYYWYGSWKVQLADISEGVCNLILAAIKMQEDLLLCCEFVQSPMRTRGENMSFFSLSEVLFGDVIPYRRFYARRRLRGQVAAQLVTNQELPQINLGFSRNAWQIACCILRIFRQRH